ncbi:20802_t:CDS:10 [Entrophospora sp. SA101]|nr:20802_t:CDS:10 [Entrophospora sp. SA101]
MDGDAKLILSLIAKINMKLPCNSGKKLEILESDPLMLQTVNSIIDLSRYRLSFIADNLARLLETISKTTLPNATEENIPIDILQSQLFIIKILSACVINHWTFVQGINRSLAKQPQSETTQTHLGGSKSNHNYHNSTNGHRVFIPPKSSDDPPPLEDFLAKFILSVLSRHAGHVIFYISASNWNVVFSRIKSRIGYLTSTNDDWPETAELKFLECSDLNSKRLSIVIQELCGSFLNLKKSAQLAMAQVLRKSIWNWIKVFPEEFIALCQSEKRLEGGPEILFDICNNLADNNRRKQFFWPLQTMLLILCPDILHSAASSERTPVMSKKVAFLENLKSSLKRPRLAEVAVECYVDICKASTYVSRKDSKALRLIVPEIENDLQERLFDPARSLTYDNQFDQSLMTDCLIALFKLNDTTLKSLIPVCLNENAPSVFKLVLVKSCYVIASDENKFPWNPQLSTMYPVLATPLRSLFHQYITSRDRLDVKKKKQTRERPDEINERMEIILTILKLYKSDPLLVLVHSDANENPDEIRRVIYGMTLCVNDHNPVIRTTAAETLIKLHDLKYIEQWSSNDKRMRSFWVISSQVMLAIARQILEYKEPEESTKYLLDLLLQLFKRRNEFLKAHKAQLTAELIGDEVDIQAVPPSELPIVENMDVYLELSSEPSIVPGRIAQQKRIRKLLRLMKKPTPGNLAAWEEAYKRWKVLTSLIARSTDDQTILEDVGKKRMAKMANQFTVVPTDSQSNEWLNYTGFLAAIGGCCVNEKQININGDGKFYDPSGNEHNEHIIVGPQGSDYHSMAEQFVQEMFDLLVCDTVYVRENVKEMLGSELSPRLYVILFRNLESVVSRFFDADGEAKSNERCTIFAEQAISILKLILERIQDASENLYTVDLGGLVLSFARYLNRLESNSVALRVKKKMCQLAEVLMIKKDYITLRQEIKLRNKLLEIFIEWTLDYSMKTDGKGNDDISSSKSERMHRDLDQACLKAIVSILAQLPLQPSETVHEADLSLVKSRLFYKYFTFFIKLLNRCRILEAIDSGTQSAKNNPDLQLLLSRSKEYVKDLGPLKDYTILALSNLLSANVDSGLKHSLSMGYHEDTKTKTAFMQVLTNILNQGTEFEGLAENAMDDRFDKLVELITDSDLSIALSLCEVCPVSDIDEVSRVLLAVFDSRHQTMPLLKAIIEKEVANTEYESDLFRRNCMATRMLTAFGKTHGAEYLRKTLQPLLANLLNQQNDFSYELNPANLGPDEDISKNLQNLINTAKSFLDVCHYIGKSVEKKYPQAKCTTIGAFIFLRFFNPAIVAPDSENLCDTIKNAKIRRTLLLVTKVIQNLANNVLFGAKEPHMILLNNFLDDNIVKMTAFLEEVSELPVASQLSEHKSREASNIHRLSDANRKAFHRHLVENQERIAKDLQTRRVKSIGTTVHNNISLDFTYANKKSWDKISTLLAQIGPPIESQKKDFAVIGTNHFETNNQLFSEFMRRNANRNIDSIISKEIFYKGGVSKEKRPLFYLILRRLEPDYIDMDLLMYHILHIIEPFMTKPLSELYEYIAPHEVRLPKGTAQLDTDNTITSYSQILKLAHYKAPIPVIMKIGGENIQVITAKKQDLIFGLSCQLNDVFHVSEIEDITFSSNKNVNNEFAIKQNGRPSFIFASPMRDTIMQAIRTSKAKYQIAKPSKVTERILRPNDVPGTLLNMTLFNIGSEDPNLRLAAYNLLVSLSNVFNFDVGNQLLATKGLCIPANNTNFIVGISEKLAASESRLTLDFLREFFVGFNKSNTPTKHLCLQYMAPWLLNLAEVAIECCVDICKASTYVSRKDSLALRLIVPEIENDLRERLFDPVRSLTYDNQFNQSLMTDCLTALFKLNNTTLRSFIPVCLNENAPSVFKLVLVKSCYAIASEENKFPWNPQLLTMYPVLATPLRNLFHQYITSRDRLDVKKKKQTRERPDEINERMEIILTILKLYKSDPLLVLVHSDANENPDEIRRVIYGMTLCVNDHNPVIRTTAAETLIKLHDLKYIEQWSSNDKRMRSFWVISSQVMLAIARQTLEYKESEESTKYLLGLLLQLFKRHNEFLKAHKLFSEFMRRNANRNIDSIVSKEIFYKGGISKA